VDRDELRRLWREAGAARAALPAAAAPPAATFMAAPAGSADALLGADLAAVGLPLGGWSNAPAAVRAASQRYAGWLAAAGRETGVRVVDYGDVAVDAADLGATFVRAHEHLADVLAAGATPLPLGGDASITVPALQVLAGKLQGRPGSSARRAPGCRRGHRGGAPARLSRPLLARRHAASAPSRGPWVSLPKHEFHRVGEPRGRHFTWSKRNPLGGLTVTRDEKEQAVDSVLARYQHLGATVVSDDSTLCRLLQTMECSDTDKQVGEYLCSFLAA
jgi:Arginase family